MYRHTTAALARSVSTSASAYSSPCKFSPSLSFASSLSLRHTGCCPFAASFSTSPGASVAVRVVTSGFGPRKITPSRVPVSKRTQTKQNNTNTPTQTATPTDESESTAADTNATNAAAAAAGETSATPTQSAFKKLTPLEMKERFPFARNLSARQPESIVDTNAYVHNRWYLAADGSLPSAMDESYVRPEVYIGSEEHVLELTRYLSLTSIIAVDTEFTTGFFYRPQLEVIQIATPHILCAVDVQLLRKTQAFKQLMAAMLEKEWVLHAHRGDLEVIRDLAKTLGLARLIPARIFDTQLAMAFLTPSSSISLALLVSDVMKKELDKSNTLSDWSRRPLTEKQIEYAIDDVKHLLQMKEILESKLKASDATTNAFLSTSSDAFTPVDSESGRSSRLEWFQEEMSLLANESLYAPLEPNAAHTGFRHKFEIGSKEHNLLLALLEWRESVAQSRNSQAHLLLTPDQLQAIAAMPPKDLVELGNIRNMKRWVVTDLGHDIIHVIATCNKDTAMPNMNRTRQYPNHHSGNRIQWGLMSLLTAVVEQRARELGISTFLLASRRDRLDIASVSSSSLLTASGWHWDGLTSLDGSSVVGGGFTRSLLPAVNYRFATITEDTMWERVLDEEIKEIIATEASSNSNDAPTHPTTTNTDEDAFESSRPVSPLAAEVEIGLLRLSKLLRGWRRAVVGQELLNLTQGKTRVAWDANSGAIVLKAARTSKNTAATDADTKQKATHRRKKDQQNEPEPIVHTT